jgi:hypothetical protein
MRPIIRLLSFAFAAAALAAAPVAASAAGGHGGGGGGHWGGGGGHWSGGGGHWGGGGWHGHGGGWGGVSIGVGFGSPWYYPYYPYYGYAPYYYPGYVVASPAYPVAAAPGDTVVSTSPQAAPEPVVYPRNGQSAEQTEADQRDCNRWATSQPRAMADASVFQRATIACLEGRGYTVR